MFFAMTKLRGKTLQILILFTLVLSNSAVAQRLEYDLKFGGIKLGDCFVEHHTFNDTSIYLLNSKVKIFYLISTHKVDYTSYSVYVKGRLLSSEVLATVNGEENSYTKTNWVNNAYDVIKREEEDSMHYQFNSPGIEYSSSKLFFVLPNPKDSSYAELYGNFCSIKKLPDHQALITNIDNDRTTHYFYEGNTPIKRKIEYPVVDFTMNRKTQTPVTCTRDNLEKRYKALISQ